MDNATPKIVSKNEWDEKLAQLLVEEKELTRLQDKLAAKRRRLPMYEIDKSYSFDTNDGKRTLSELFDGREQLIIYHFMYDPKWEEGCPGCSWVLDAMSHEAHLNACGISLVIIGKAPLEKLISYRDRMGWKYKWASSFESDFNVDIGATKDFGEDHGVSVFLKKEGRIFRTYYSGDRGVERLGSHWTYLDLTPYGRKEKWEDSPEGWPQFDTYTINKRHDQYDNDGRVNSKCCNR